MITLLRSNERDLLVDELILKIDSGTGFRPLLRALGSAIGRIEGGSTGYEMARNVVYYCERSAWLEAPPLMVRVLDEHAYRPELAAASVRINSQKPPIFYRSSALWNTCRVAMEMPFLNREKTRRCFEDFTRPLAARPKFPEDPLPARTLIVSGPPGSGKSLTRDFARYLEMIQPTAIKVATVDYRTLPPGVLGQTALARELLKTIAPDEMVDLRSDETMRPERRAEFLAEILANAARNSLVDCYLVLDNFDELPDGDEAHILIDHLVVGLSGKETTWSAGDPPLRLLLLGHRRELPTRVGPRERTRVESIIPIDEHAIASFFSEYCLWKGWNLGTWPNQPDFLKEQARQIADAAPPLPERHRQIAALVLRVAAAWDLVSE